MTPVRLEREGPLAVVTLDAAPLNLFDSAMIEFATEDVRGAVRTFLEKGPGRATFRGT